MTDCQIDIQIASEMPATDLPDASEIRSWIGCAVAEMDEAEVTIRIVDEEESRHLNQQYRGKNKATNVLSFPFEVPMEIDLPLLGDLVICAPVVVKEAQEQDKKTDAHWAHMIIHGMLHLQGFDHQTDSEAVQMENLEIALMADLGFDNPYA